MTGPEVPTPHPRRKDLADFPTPPGLVAEVLEALGSIGGRFDRVLEPTCGRGHFIEGIIGRPDRPGEIRGFEIQPGHAEAARTLGAPGVHLVIETADLFRLDLSRQIPWSGSGRLLVVGNLPWVTAAEVAASGGSNGPSRSNVRNLRGIDAMTGASNFDVSEAIWLKLIRELAPERPTIAAPLLVGRRPERAPGRLDGRPPRDPRDTLAGQRPPMVPGLGRRVPAPGRGRAGSESHRGEGLSRTDRPPNPSRPSASEAAG